MEKLKNMFKDKNRKIENLVVFLIILVITLIVINNIIKEDEQKESKDYSDAELASTLPEEKSSNDLETKLEKILSQMEGVGEVSVLVTYSQSKQIIPMYNESTSKSITEETDTNGGVRTIQSEDNEKSVVTGSDSNPVTSKSIYPSIEGAIVMAEGASNTTVKANIISAVEAVTGLATHKVQVFQMNRKDGLYE